MTGDNFVLLNELNPVYLPDNRKTLTIILVMWLISDQAGSSAVLAECKIAFLQESYYYELCLIVRPLIVFSNPLDKWLT